MTYWKTTAFKKLQQAWYARLEAEGFHDAEEVCADELRLKQSTCIELTIFEVERRQDYYRILSHKIHETVFKDEIERLILTLFADGRTAEEICRELRARGTPRFRHAIRFTVRRYEHLWGIKQHTPSQLGKRQRRRPTTSSPSSDKT